MLSQPLVASFSTIRATLLHIWLAEAGWLSRLKGENWDTSHISGFTGSTQELFSSWQATSQAFKDFVEKVDLDKKITFEKKGTSYTIPSSEIIQTVFNHGSFHRGQVVMMMRQLGFKEISQTDYIEWVRVHIKSSGN